MNNLKNQKITPFLWFDNNAAEAINFYTSIFPNSKINLLRNWPEGGPFPPNTIHAGSFILDGVHFYAFDAGPQFKFTPAISFFAVYETDQEIDALWNKLIEGGEALMPLDRYAWSERYGWLTDRFGISWQLMKGNPEDVGQKITPLLFFTGAQRGRAEEAMNLYMSVFKESVSDGILKYAPGEIDAEGGMVKHAQCRLMGQTFMLMDTAIEESDFPFNEAISLFVSCQDQQEVDYYWESFTKEGQEQPCGWVKDKFGVSWQIVPGFLLERLTEGESGRVQNMMEALYKMKKLDVAALERAYNQ